MRNDTRTLFIAYCSRLALLNSVASVAATFAVAPAVEQKLEEIIKQGSEFLQLINVTPVTQQSGDKLGLGTTRSIAGRTNTANNNRRQPSDPTDSALKDQYFCTQTDYDHAFGYAKLDAWRHRPEFQTTLRDAIAKQQGRDRIMIGWNGTSRAAQTDRVVNPLLQDVNIGWLHKIRTNAPAQVIDDGALTANPTKAIYVANGAGIELLNLEGTNGATADADYANLDALVLDAKNALPEWHRGDTELVVIVGHELVDDKYFNIVNKTGDTATEVEAADRILRSQKQLGGLPAIRVPFFPADALLITRLDNLSIYWQEETRRRMLKDEPEYNRIANYESVNEDFVVEDYELTVLVENIVRAPKPA